jgi:hypothetical protein
MIPTRRTLLALFTFALLGTRAFGLVTDEYQWSNFVGNVSGIGHANATGTNAQFQNPQGVASDSSGNLYVADTANHIIRKIDTAGVVSTLAGTAGVTGTEDGVGSAAQFNAPAGIAVSANGVVYVADTGNDTIRRISPDGTVKTIAGTPRVTGTTDGLGTALFNSPEALAVNAAGAIFVADTLNNTIRKVTYQGDVTTVAGQPRVTGTANGIGSAARFFHPAGIALDNAGSRFLIADTQNDTIRVLKSDGLVSTFAGTPRVSGSMGGAPGFGELNKPTGIVILSADEIYVTDSASNTVRRIYRTGVIGDLPFAGMSGKKGSADGQGEGARFDDPTGLAAGTHGSIYVADTGNSTIRKITSKGAVTTFAGRATVASSTNGTGTGAGFDYPCGVALSGSNTVYIADTDNDTIRMATKEGVVTTFAGVPHLTGTTNGAGGIVRFFHPTGLVTDTNGNVYVADTDNDAIRMITPAGLVSTFAGIPGLPGSANGAAASAQFNHPRGITFDKLGNMYIADTGNDTIREISGGQVSTFAGTPAVSGTMDGASGVALFDQPEGVVADGTNGLYVADTHNQTIRRILPNGTVSTFAGSPHHRGSKDGVAKVARFDNPSGITEDNHNRIFVADAGGDTIREIEPDLKAVSTVTTIGGTANLRGSAEGVGADANFAEPHGIVATPEHGVLYVADSLNNRVVKGISTGGTLKVKLTPPAAVSAGAVWYLDGGNTAYTSGAVVRDLTTGAHTVTFKTVPNFTTPSQQIVNVSAFATTVATGDYAEEYGSATVTITPQAAINAGAQWKIEGKTYNSGDTANNLTAGTHTVIFTALHDFDRPASQTITVPVNGNVATTGTYNLRSGSLMVNLIPAGAVTAGAQWNVDGGSEQSSGAIVTGLSLGSHTVNFSAATGYNAPASQMVTIYDQQTTVTTGTYSGIPVISVQEPVGTALTNNSSTVNFGPVVSGSTLSLQFAIVNAGTAPLTGLSLAIGGANADRFTASSLTSGTLAIGGTSNFTVGCTPIGLGAIAATLTVTSNDPVNPTFTVALAATGTNGPVTFKYSAGSYVGLLTGTNNSVRGYAALTLSAKGALTGKFYLDGVLTGPSTVVHGAFATNGQYTGTPSNVSMLLTSGSGGPGNPAGYQILSTATSLSGPVPYIAYHAAYTATQKVTEGRKYTLLMSGTDTSSTVPQGTSYATLTIPASGGSASLSGKLADGTAFTYASFIASGPYGHQILVFDGSLYHSKGFFGGPLTFAPLTDTDLTGIFQWVNPGGQSKILYPSGFNTLLDVAGALYVTPVRNNQPIPLSTGTFTVSGGGLPSPIPEPIFLTVYPAEKIIITGNDGNPSNLKVTLNGAAGSFTGSFIHTVTGKTVSFSGLLYQNNNDPGAAGYFVGPSLIGNGAGTMTTGTALSGNVQLAP